jgi:hypothetical protein
MDWIGARVVLIGVCGRATGLLLLSSFRRTSGCARWQWCGSIIILDGAITGVYAWRVSPCALANTTTAILMSRLTLPASRLTLLVCRLTLSVTREADRLMMRAPLLQCFSGGSQPCSGVQAGVNSCCVFRKTVDLVYLVHAFDLPWLALASISIC